MISKIAIEEILPNTSADMRAARLNNKRSFGFIFCKKIIKTGARILPIINMNFIKNHLSTIVAIVGRLKPRLQTFRIYFIELFRPITATV